MSCALAYFRDGKMAGLRLAAVIMVAWGATAVAVAAPEDSAGAGLGSLDLNPTTASLLVRTETADIDSSFSRQAARTTTGTEPYRYELKNPHGLTLLYNACRSSKIEPCGCRGLNLGGIDKEAAMVQHIRANNPQTLYMDAGGYFRENPDPAMRLQTWFMLKALAQLDCQVMNVGYPDLQQGMGSLKFFEKKFHLPFISANIIDAATGQPVFSPFKSFEMTLSQGVSVRVAVVGVTSPSRDASRGAEGAAAGVRPGRWMIAETNGQVPWLPYDVHAEAPPVLTPDDGSPSTPGGDAGGAAPVPPGGGKHPLAMRFAAESGDAITSGPVAPYKVGDPLARARELGKELKKTHDVIILLAYSSFARAVQMAPELAEYDLVVAADYVDRMEPVRPAAEGPLVVSGDHEGKYLGIVEAAAPAAGARAALSEPDMLPVLQTILPLPAFQKLVEEFEGLTKQLPAEQPVEQPAEKLYAGASSCRACHATEFTQWKTHRHSKAMKTLVDRNMHYNPDCLKCHTVAYRMPGGFTDLRVNANLANVQCEVCHGPAEAHVKEMRAAEALQREGKPVPPAQAELRMEWDQNFCMQCHDAQNDPQFNFNRDIMRVRHKDTAPPRVRPQAMSADKM